jgi:hypothetical protein
MEELPWSRLMQVESEGQQKSFGSFVLPQRVNDEGHASELLERRSTELYACPGRMLAIRVNSSRTDGCDLVILTERM